MFEDIVCRLVLRVGFIIVRFCWCLFVGWTLLFCLFLYLVLFSGLGFNSGYKF